MAVRHGYGKIAGTDALAFAYDTGDPRNSYKGEPTTNLIPSGVAFAHATGQGNAATVEDAPEKGPGWKKVTITARGTNFRTLQWTYLSMTANNLYCHSIVFDWGNMRGKNYFIYFDGDGTGTRAYYRPGDYVNTGGTNIDSSMPDGKFAGTITHTGNHTHAFFIGNYTLNQSGLNDYFYYKEYQAEVNSHPTQYTGGTRSATQGLLDLTGNSSIDLSNVSFDSNAQLTFDGSNDYVDLSSATSLLNLGSTFSIEGILKLDNTSQEFGTVFSSLDVATGSQTKGVGFYWKKTAEYGMSANTIRLQLGLAAWSWHIFASNGISISDTNYHHVAVTLTGGNTSSPTIVFYIDGVAQAATKWTAGSTGAINNSSNANSLRLGSIYTASNPSYNNFYSAELLNVVKIYNRVLTASEVANNYRQYKSRFNL